MADLDAYLRETLRSELDEAFSRHLGAPSKSPIPYDDEAFEAAVRRRVLERVEEIREQVDVVLIREAAEITGISTAKLYKMRLNGIGPASRKWGARVGYNRADLELWMEFRRDGILKSVPQDIDLDEL